MLFNTCNLILFMYNELSNHKELQMAIVINGKVKSKNIARKYTLFYTTDGREWPVYLELPNRGLVCLGFKKNYEFRKENEPQPASLQTKFMEIDLEDASISEDCQFLATTY